MSKDREASARMLTSGAFCIAGIVAIKAKWLAPSTPQRTGSTAARFDMPPHSIAGRQSRKRRRRALRPRRPHQSGLTWSEHAAPVTLLPICAASSVVKQTPSEPPDSPPLVPGPS